MNNNNKIYVGRLPPNTKEEVLRDIFQGAGVTPLKINIIRNFALVDLPEDFPVEKAVEMFNGYAVMGSQLLVEPALPPNTPNRRNRASAIQISNIPELYPWDEFCQLLSSIGSVQHIEKGTSRQNTYSAIATYENQEQAQQAQVQLSNYEVQQGAVLKVDCLMDLGRGRGGRGGRAGSRPFGNSFRSNDFPLRILVLSDMVGAIIGRAGGTIRQITQQSRARVDVHRKENAGSPEKVITIYGTPENCSTACQKIMEIMQQEANTTNRGEIPLKILAHNNLIGRIIGKNGNTIKRIMEQTETMIAVSSNIHDISSFNLERIITVKGKIENIAKAEKMISAKLRQSYENDLAAISSQTYMYPGVHPMAMMSTACSPGMMPPPRGPAPSPYGMYGGPCMPPMGYPPHSPPNSSMFPPSAEVQREVVYVYIPNTAVGAIIGTGGSTIREMISGSGATCIKVAPPSKDDPAEKLTERKVNIIGNPESQWKAQYMIFKKVGFEGYPGPQEASLKVEIYVPLSQVGRIIGKGGQTVRELQRLTHALIKFPEGQEYRIAETDETAVHIIGDFYSTQAAQRQIRAIVYKSIAYQQRRRMSQQSLPNIQQN